jgi:CcmD family protein
VPWKPAARRVAFALFLIIASSGAAASLAAQQPPQKPAQDEFLPVDQLPPGEQLPAARFLIIAYSVAWVLVAGYLFSIWKRLGRVEHEIADVTRRVQQASSAAPKGGGGDRGAR